MGHFDLKCAVSGLRITELDPVRLFLLELVVAAPEDINGGIAAYWRPVSEPVRGVYAGYGVQELLDEIGNPNIGVALILEDVWSALVERERPHAEPEADEFKLVEAALARVHQLWYPSSYAGVDEGMLEYLRFYSMIARIAEKRVAAWEVTEAFSEHTWTWQIPDGAGIRERLDAAIADFVAKELPHCLGPHNKP